MKSAVVLTFASAAAANYYSFGDSYGDWRPSSTAAAPPSYTSGVAASKAPSSAGFQNATFGLSKGGQAVCVDGYIPVSAQTANNLKINFPVPANQSVVTDTFLKYITAGSPFVPSIIQGKQTVGGVFSIKATLCTPKNNTKPSEVQFLTHGVGFDRSYWDFAPGYSYVDVAAAHGYATFFYDRLGVGQSQKADPIQVLQAPLEVEVAKSIATSLRAGAYSGNQFSKVIGVGHSFGSIISEAVTAMYPSTFDAAILTGFSINASAVGAFVLGNNFAIAAQNNPARFAGLNNAFVVSDTIISTQIGFFRLPQFDGAVLAAADATKQTATFGEFFTLGAVGGVATGFTGPVAVVNGNSDLPFCTGNCSYPVNLAAEVAVLYPAVPPTSFATYLAPDTGHGLNLHFTANAAFEFIQNFLANHGL